jgi:hypothetical protein
MAEKARRQDKDDAAPTRSAREQSTRKPDQADPFENAPLSQGAEDEPASGPGQLAVDDRGNISWEWADDPELQGDDLVSRTARLRALAPGHLSVVDEELDCAAVDRDPIPVRKKPPGYNPYENGEPTKKTWKKKRDLREFSKWISLKKRLKSEPGKS